MSTNAHKSISGKGETCLNCGRALQDEEYCADCGQLNTDRNISIGKLIQDFLGDYFSFDSKLFKTLIPLLTKPGQAPLEFINGQRVKHIPPLRLFIFISFVFFFILGQVSNLEDYRLDMSDGFSFVKTGISQQDANSPENVVSPINIHLDEDDSLGTAEFEKGRTLFFKLLDSGMKPKQAIDSIDFKGDKIERKLLVQTGKLYQSDPSTISKFYFGNLSIVLLIIQPLFAFMLWLLYIRRRKQFRFIGHLIFSLYFHAWFLILSSVLLILFWLFDNFYFEHVLVLSSGLYLFFSIKKYYGQSWLKSILKTLLTFALYGIILIPAVTLSSILISFFLF